MSFINKAFHSIAHLACLSKEKQFIKDATELKKNQLKKLHQISSYETYDEFLKNNNLNTYEDFEDEFLNLKKDYKIGLAKNIVRFEPTSGSTSKVKWIPYTKSFLSEIDSAFSPMMAELYQKYSYIKNGKHFWSLSWLPEEFRSEFNNDDSELLNPFKAFFFKRILSLDASAVKTSSVHQARLNSSICLLSGDISLISVWSPTYFIELINFAIENKKKLLPKLNLEAQKRLSRVNSFNEADALFPNKIVFSSWGEASAKKWLNQVKEVFKNFDFVEKGVWCTEGVITIPFNGLKPLSYNSHFYEFLDISTSRVVPSWEVLKGRIYQPILTTSSGLIRYHIEDNLECYGFFKSVPCFNFLGRDKHSDMVGEKLSQETAEKIITKFESIFSQKVISLYANDKTQTKPRYEIYISGEVDKLADDFFEKELNEYFHYKQAREKNQLGKSFVIGGADALSKYYERRKASGLIDGNIKIEPITFSI